jgi:hypothetical protein
MATRGGGRLPQTLKSSSLRPAARAAFSQLGCSPRPLQLSPVASLRYFAATFARAPSLAPGTALPPRSASVAHLGDGLGAVAFFRQLDFPLERLFLRQQFLQGGHVVLPGVKTSGEPILGSARYSRRRFVSGDSR